MVRGLKDHLVKYIMEGSFGVMSLKITYMFISRIHRFIPLKMYETVRFDFTVIKGGTAYMRPLLFGKGLF